MKVSDTQLRVLGLMAAGWQLASSMSSWSSGSRLQYGGAGKGGETKRVHGNTVHALWKAGLIFTESENFPTRTYGLTSAGRAALEEADV